MNVTSVHLLDTNAEALSGAKEALRRAALARRARLDPAYREAASRRIALAALAALPARDGIAALFWSIRDEVDTRPLMERLTARGRRIALPVVMGRGRPLVFRAWRPGAPLRQAAFGLSEPLEDVEEVAPSVLLVPLAAFDATCHRIGYGGGFYDRTITALASSDLGSPMTIGLAFAAQEVASIPAEPHDRRLDRIVTESGLFERKGA